MSGHIRDSPCLAGKSWLAEMGKTSATFLLRLGQF